MAWLRLWAEIKNEKCSRTWRILSAETCPTHFARSNFYEHHTETLKLIACSSRALGSSMVEIIQESDKDHQPTLLHYIDRFMHQSDCTLWFYLSQSIISRTSVRYLLKVSRFPSGGRCLIPSVLTVLALGIREFIASACSFMHLQPYSSPVTYSYSDVTNCSVPFTWSDEEAGGEIGVGWMNTPSSIYTEVFCLLTTPRTLQWFFQ